MNCIDYKIGIALAAADIPFTALLTAAMLRADTSNVRRINHEWPMLARDYVSRCRFTGGVLPGESTDRDRIEELSQQADTIAESYLSRVNS